jgi:cytochrome P450
MYEVKSNPAITALMNVLFTGSVINIFRRLPFLMPLAPFMIPISKLKKERQMHQDFSRDLIRKRISKGNNRPDFFGHLLVNEAERPSEEFLRTNASSLLIAGSETTATALAGATYYLLERPECLRALQHEVRTAFKSHDEINEASTRDLLYVNAIIKEALRIFIPLPINVPRVSPGAVVDGRYVPKGVRSLPMENICTKVRRFM